jgi:hypothetical protein
MKRLIAAATVLAVTSPAALAAAPFIKTTPTTVKRGNTVTVSGSAGTGCANGSRVTIMSKAFKGATSHQFAGVPAVYAKAGNGGKFLIKVTIKKTVKKTTYGVSARCGGGLIGSSMLMVT